MTERSDAERLIDSANKLANSIHDKYWDLGEVLYELKENDFYKLIEGKKYYSDKHTKWKSFCEDKLDIGYRTAQYWLNIYRYFTDMGIEKDELKKIGWSKAKELIDLTEDVNVLRSAMKKAESSTLEELQHFCATIEKSEKKLGEDTRETLKTSKFTFYFQEAAAEAVEEIINETAQKCEGDRNAALFQILIEWKQAQIPENVDPFSEYQVEEEKELEAVIV
jgi:hypothetical protein